ncbi:Hypothetical predicted protein, partial [Olea europaea subsp. europaea]
MAAAAASAHFADALGRPLLLLVGGDRRGAAGRQVLHVRLEAGLDLGAAGRVGAAIIHVVAGAVLLERLAGRGLLGVCGNRAEAQADGQEDRLGRGHGCPCRYPVIARAGRAVIGAAPGRQGWRDFGADVPNLRHPRSSRCPRATSAGKVLVSE